jgi:cbb3-type cytochrome oxidase subunit 3
VKAIKRRRKEIMSKTHDLLKKGALVLTGNAVVAVLGASTAHAVAGIGEGAGAAQGDGQQTDLVANIRTVTNTMLFAIGVVAVIMLIVGGFRYIFSAGNSTNVNAAKDTILYSVIGIVVALLAYAIIHFVLGQFGAA